MVIGNSRGAVWSAADTVEAKALTTRATVATVGAGISGWVGGTTRDAAADGVARAGGGFREHE